MTDKEKFRKGVERLKSNLIYGACSSQVAMENHCKEEAYNEVLAILDTMQEEPVSTRDKLRALSDGKQHLGWLDDAREVEEEPVSDDLEKEIEQYCIHHGYLDPFKDCGYTFNEQVDDIARHFAKWQKQQDSIPSKDLEELIDTLSKRYPEISFAKLSRIAVRVSRWQQNQDVKNKLPKVINRTDLDEYAYQCAYDMSNDWAIENPTWHDVEDACKLGANWQKEQMTAKAIDGVITFDYYGDGDKTYGCIAHDSFCLEDRGLKDNDTVRIYVFKEE